MRRVVLCLLLSLAPAATAQAQMPAGLNTWINMSEWCREPKPGFTATVVAADTTNILKILQTAAHCHLALVTVVPRRLYTNADGTYSPTRHRKVSDGYGRAIKPDTARKYVANHTWLGHMVGDDYGCNWCWGNHGETIPLTEARDAANYAKSKMPNANIGVRVDAQRIIEQAPSGWNVDFAWAQWVATAGTLRRWGTPAAWYKVNATAAASLGLKMFYGLNTVHCTGQDSPPCTPDQVKSFGTAAVNQPGNCGLISWRWDEGIWSGAYKSEWTDLFNTAATKPFTACRR